MKTIVISIYMEIYIVIIVCIIQVKFPFPFVKTAFNLTLGMTKPSTINIINSILFLNLK